MTLSKRWGVASLSKKMPNVEVLDEEEWADWDERDKADNERNKKFEKHMAETIARERRWRKSN